MRKIKIVIWSLLTLAFMAYVIFIYYKDEGWWNYLCPFIIYVLAMLFVLAVWIENNQLKKKFETREKELTEELDEKLILINKLLSSQQAINKLLNPQQ